MQNALTPEEYGQKAYDYFTSGYNCAQTALCTFADLFAVEHDVLMKMASGFGGGIGRLREVCGCLTGDYMALGMLVGSTDPNDHETKARLYALIQAYAAEFQKDHGSIYCRDLLDLQFAGADDPIPEKRTPEYYQKRPCGRLCRENAIHFAAFLQKEGIL